MTQEELAAALLTAFGKQLQDLFASVRRDERERCAKIAEGIPSHFSSGMLHWTVVGGHIAEHIRKGGAA